MNKRSIFTLGMATVLVLTLLCPPQANAASSGEIRKQINALQQEKAAIKKKIAEVKEQYKENENEIANIIAKKNTIDQEIQLLYAEIDNTNQQISAYSVLIADKQDELDEANTRYDTMNEENKVRIRAMEEEGSVSYWEVIFKASSFTDLLDRLNMVSEIAQADKKHLKELGEAAQAVVVAQDALEEEKIGLEVVKQELDETQTELDAKRKEADELILELLAKAEDLEALEADFEAQEAAFLEEIAAMEQEYTAAKQAEWEAYMATYVPPTTAPVVSSGTTTSSTATNSSNNSGSTNSGSSGGSYSGGWVVPCSYTSITSPFGTRTSPTTGASIYHQGVDLDTGTGWPVYASRAGIAYTSYGSAAGNYVTIDHRDGFKSIYMHLSGFSISSGSMVSAGQQIGLTGSTGVSTGDHLHFGISYNGAYVNPCQYVGLY